ncbi:hypothetical protein B0H10DRAFT_833363 [Mycena sp. CBHHK59/15]|nr:hypothetical protein B0H10DRAFT_833363 [Mycena sp. CBHHK59/15]
MLIGPVYQCHLYDSGNSPELTTDGVALFIAVMLAILLPSLGIQPFRTSVRTPIVYIIYIQYPPLSNTRLGIVNLTVPEGPPATIEHFRDYLASPLFEGSIQGGETYDGALERLVRANLVVVQHASNETTGIESRSPFISRRYSHCLFGLLRVEVMSPLSPLAVIPSLVLVQRLHDGEKTTVWRGTSTVSTNKSSLLPNLTCGVGEDRVAIPHAESVQ